MDQRQGHRSATGGGGQGRGLVSGRTCGQNPDYDYGAIKPNCTSGYTVGWFGVNATSSNITGLPSSIAGYPADKPTTTMWRSDDMVRQTQARRLYYANDTSGGYSGSPVWSDQGCQACAIAIHTNGVDYTGYNSGTRITQEVYNNLMTWAYS